MSRVVFNLENRGSLFIYHWLVFMVAGFRHIKNGGFICKDNDGGGVVERNKHLFKPDMLKPPYNVYMKNDMLILTENENNYIKETFDLIKDEFVLINENDIKPDDIILNNYGEYITHRGNMYVISNEGYNYVKNLLEKSIVITQDDINKYSDKKYYLCRNRAHLLAGNKTDLIKYVKRRHIVNETDLINELTKNNVECIYLEEYSLVEKIKLFKLAKLVIAPNSGGLTFSMFGDSSKLTVVEINIEHTVQATLQFSHMCKSFSIRYFKYTAEKLDSNDNMRVNVDILIKGLKNNNLI